MQNTEQLSKSKGEANDDPLRKSRSKNECRTRREIAAMAVLLISATAEHVIVQHVFPDGGNVHRIDVWQEGMAEKG